MKNNNLIDSIYSYKIDLYEGNKGSDRIVFTKEEILDQNNMYIVLKDHFFTKLEKPSREAFGVTCDIVDKPRIRFKSVIDENGIFFRMYSSTKKRPGTIISLIEKEIQNKYGWLMRSEYDLSVIEKELV